jgi:vacuolar iron transporter family protein
VVEFFVFQHRGGDTGIAVLFGLQGVVALLVAAVVTGLALMLTGATVAVLSGEPPLRRAMRQLAIGAAAAVVTYLLGLVFGATIG